MWPPSSLAWVRRSKWAALAAGVWIECTSGSAYCFGIYSPLLKSSQSYDQSTLDSVAFFKDIGANVGIPSGLLYSAPFGGPRAVIIAGAILCFAGYFLMWLTVTGALPRPPAPVMCLYMLVAAHSATFFNTGNVVTAVENFPNSRGTVIGIMKGFLGLSGAILIQLYRTIFNGNPSSFLLMLALLPSLLPLLLVYFVQVHKRRNEGANKSQLDAFSVIALSTAAYLMIVIIAEDVLSLGLLVRILTLVGLLMLLVCPLIIVTKAQLAEPKILPQEASSSQEKILLIDDSIASPNQDRHIPVAPSRENLNLLQAMGTCDFWLLFLAMACGMGSGLATVNNISQIGNSLDYSLTATSSLVSLWSVWNFLGRFGAGYISDYLLSWRGWARPLFIAITLALMSVGHVVIASGLPGTLYVGSVLVGVCYGSQWALMPTITSELFGLRHFGTIFNSITIASPVGSYVLSVRVMGYIYDIQSTTSSSGVAVCTGRQCFMLSFFIMASVTLFGFSIALALFYRTRRFYEQVIFPHLKASVVH